MYKISSKDPSDKPNEAPQLNKILNPAEKLGRTKRLITDTLKLVQTKDTNILSMETQESVKFIRRDINNYLSLNSVKKFHSNLLPRSKLPKASSASTVIAIT